MMPHRSVRARCAARATCGPHRHHDTKPLALKLAARHLRRAQDTTTLWRHDECCVLRGTKITDGASSPGSVNLASKALFIGRLFPPVFFLGTPELFLAVCLVRAIIVLHWSELVREPPRNHLSTAILTHQPLICIMPTALMLSDANTSGAQLQVRRGPVRQADLDALQELPNLLNLRKAARQAVPFLFRRL
jgi:hypothetical protein